MNDIDKIRNISKEQLLIEISNATSISNILKRNNITPNSNIIKLLKSKIKEYDIIINFKNKPNEKLIKVEKTCPICNSKFLTKIGTRNEKTTCSHSCSNTFFNGKTRNINVTRYRTICFRTNPKKCIICDEDKIVEVHHYDEDRNNNNIDNLIPLCPTHHKYAHSRHKHLVLDKINKFREACVRSLPH